MRDVVTEPLDSVLFGMIWKPWRREKKGPSLDEQIQELEERAATTPPGFRGQHLNRAGDLCAGAGDTGRAVRLWGQAIDSYLLAARPEAAAAMCRKVIRKKPDVVRARRTLALLAVGRGHLQDAIGYVQGYVDAARAEGDRALAVKQLGVMAEATPEPEFRRHVVKLLRELGDDAAADRIERAALEGQEMDGERREDADRWSTMLQVALMSPEQVRRTL